MLNGLYNLPKQKNDDGRVDDGRVDDGQASDDQASDDQASDEQVSDEQVSDGQASDEQASDDQASDDQASDDQASDDQASDDQASDEQPNDEQISDEQANDVPALHTDSTQPENPPKKRRRNISKKERAGIIVQNMLTGDQEKGMRSHGHPDGHAIEPLRFCFEIMGDAEILASPSNAVWDWSSAPISIKKVLGKNVKVLFLLLAFLCPVTFFPVYQSHHRPIVRRLSRKINMEK